MADVPVFSGGYMAGAFIPSGLMEFSHYTAGGDPVFVPSIRILEPGPSGLLDLMRRTEKPGEVVDWMAVD